MTGEERRLMGAQRWTVALDGYLIPIGGGREREVYDDGEQVVLAADHDRDAAEAEARGWNAALDEVGSARVRTLDPSLLDVLVALRKPEVEG